MESVSFVVSSRKPTSANHVARIARRGPHFFTTLPQQLAPSSLRRQQNSVRAHFLILGIYTVVYDLCVALTRSYTFTLVVYKTLFRLILGGQRSLAAT